MRHEYTLCINCVFCGKRNFQAIQPNIVHILFMMCSWCWTPNCTQISICNTVQQVLRVYLKTIEEDLDYLG